MKKIILFLAGLIFTVLTYGQTIPDVLVNVRQFGVKGDGTNETQKIQNALNVLATKGGGTLYIPKGTYIINSIAHSIGLTIPSNTIIKGDGIGLTILKRTDGDAKFSRLIGVTNASNITFENFTVDGNRDKQDIHNEQQHNFFMDHATNIKFTGIESRNTVGDGIYFFIGSKNATVSNCVFDKIYRVGVNVTNLDGGVINACKFNDADNGIKVEKNQIGLTSPSRNITISNCDFEASSINIKCNGVNINGLKGDLVSSVSIIKNTFKRIYFCVTGLRYVDNIIVQNNVADSVQSMCRSLSYSLGVGFSSGSILVEDNKVTNGIGANKADNLVYAFWYFKKAIIRNNTFIESPLHPYNAVIRSIENEYVEFSNNTITASGTVSGVMFTKCPEVNFTHNYLKLNSSGDAVVLTDDAKIKFSSVSIKDNKFEGSYRYALSDVGASTGRVGSSSVLDYQNNECKGNHKGATFNIPNTFFRSKQ
jgi:hypothetical protein